jgi:hypothetical protein
MSVRVRGWGPTQTLGEDSCSVGNSRSSAAHASFSESVDVRALTRAFCERCGVRLMGEAEWRGCTTIFILMLCAVR